MWAFRADHPGPPSLGAPPKEYAKHGAPRVKMQWDPSAKPRWDPLRGRADGTPGAQRRVVGLLGGSPYPPPGKGVFQGVKNPPREALRPPPNPSGGLPPAPQAPPGPGKLPLPPPARKAAECSTWNICRSSIPRARWYAVGGFREGEGLGVCRGLRGCALDSPPLTLSYSRQHGGLYWAKRFVPLASCGPARARAADGESKETFP